MTPERTSSHTDPDPGFAADRFPAHPQPLSFIGPCLPFTLPEEPACLGSLPSCFYSALPLRPVRPPFHRQPFGSILLLSSPLPLPVS
jgi:hypothetical protein